MSEVNKYITWIETIPTLGQINGVKMTVTTKEYSDLFRYCDDIDMFAWDRPINDTENHFNGELVIIELTIVIQLVTT